MGCGDLYEISVVRLVEDSGRIILSDSDWLGILTLRRSFGGGSCFFVDCLSAGRLLDGRAADRIEDGFFFAATSSERAKQMRRVELRHHFFHSITNSELILWQIFYHL